LSNIGFAFLANNLWSALLFRALSGLGLAGTFIPGLKAIIDRLESSFQPRAISFYTASFGMGMSFSFYYAGEMFKRFGWEQAFGIAAVGSVLSFILAFLVLTPKTMQLLYKETAISSIIDFRPVWRNQSARMYIFAYMCHMWEMFAVRSWMVAFLSFTITLQKKPICFIAPTTIVALAGLCGMVASIIGGELAIRLGRRQVVIAIMGISCSLALVIGYSAQLPYTFVVILCIIYTIFFQGDSAAIHVGVIAAAETKRRGTTMALQSLCGFAAASLGTVVAGIVLDISGGGTTPVSWGITFGAIGIIAALGPILLHRNHRSLTDYP
jgi:predicted MFS family arabinose efflux permease